MFGAGKWMGPGLLSQNSGGGLLGGGFDFSGLAPFNKLPGIGVSARDAVPMRTPYLPTPPAPAPTPAPTRQPDAWGNPYPAGSSDWQNFVLNSGRPMASMGPGEQQFYANINGGRVLLNNEGSRK